MTICRPGLIALASAIAAILRAVKFNEQAQRAGISGFVQKMGMHTDAAGFLALLVKWFVRLIVLVTAQEVSGTVRREEARIDREGDVKVGGSGWDQVMPGYRQRWQERYGTSGDRWEDAEPGYRYGHEMRGRPEYRGRQWTEVEPEFRRDWTQRNPGRPWDKASRSVRETWEESASR